ncbi:MAG: hypothetical protein E7077_14885 [Bacteroidales bacterium]|jgi:hypothetical protein|nr:hypothetical protein [Bacteroidales bacterium]
MNFKFLPFVIGMALASTAANAADGSFDNLTVNSSSTLNGTTVLKLNKTSGYFLRADNQKVSAYNTMFYVTSSGEIGGTSLHLQSQSASHCCSPQLNITYSDENQEYRIKSSGYMGRFYPLVFTASKFTFNEGEVVINNKLTCKDELEVIGLTASTIKADDINVNMNNAADYVFDESYNLKSLSEVESYVNEHKHLPGIPSAAEMEQNGVSVSAMSNMLLEKVEELTLHMIRLEKENAALKAEVKSLKK